MIWSRIVGILISLALQLLLSISLVLTMFGRMIITGLYHFLRFDQSLYEQLQTMTDPTVYLMLFLSLMMLYFLLPKVVIPKIRYVLPGSIFVVLILFGLINIFGASIDSYMRRFLDVRFAGSIVLILIMVWFILIAKVLIIGSILNATYQHCSEKSSEGFKNKEHRNKVTARLNN